MNVNAQAMPSPSNAAFTLIENGNANAIWGGFLNYGIFPFLPDQATEIIQNIFDANPVSIDPSDCNVRPLTEVEKDNIENDFQTHFYDSNGNEISLNDLYYCTYDNGYMNGEFYIDSDGNLLFGANDGSNTLLNINFAGDAKSINDWDAIYQELSSQIENNNFAFTENDVQITPQCYFYWYGETANYRPQSAHYYYCVNEYNPGVIMRMINESGQTVFYANDPTALIYECTLGGSYDQRRITSGDFYYNSIHYNYKIVLPWDGNFSANNTYDYWVSLVGSNDLYRRIFAANGTMWDSSLAQNAHSASMFKPIQYDNDVVVPMPIDETFPYDELISYIQEAINNAEYNPSFDGRNSLSSENYPFNYPIGTEIGISTLPFPEPQPSPEPIPMPQPNIDPSVGQDIGEVDPSNLRSEIPIINNLLNRFPFSIPWDIYSLLNGFSVQRETPYIDTTIHIPGINYDWHIEYDLSDFNRL